MYIHSLPGSGYTYNLNAEEQQATEILLKFNVDASKITAAIKELIGKKRINRDIFNLKGMLKYEGKDEVNAPTDVMQEVVDQYGQIRLHLDCDD